MSLKIENTDPQIYFHGRWDTSPGTWWAGTGFKLHVQNLHSLALDLGPHTTSPLTSIAVSVDYNNFTTVNVSSGTNVIPVRSPSRTSVVRINVEGWQNNRMNLESLALNSGASLLSYKPSELAFLFIGDSLSAGQYIPMGVDQAWTFIVGERFKAEHTVIAQPGITLTDVPSYGNVHGMSFQFFKTEDTGYYYTTDHNYTTPWDFSRDKPTPTHIVIHIGANDASHPVSGDEFVQVYLDFIRRLRRIYDRQPIFVFTPWGWPAADGEISYYYDGRYEQIVVMSNDKNIFLVNATGWVSWDDVFPDNLHPTVAGHQKIAGEFMNWLENRGLKPESQWATPVLA
ncbi:SGNH hydrolase [Guyanagaster necrorhizus]|uniref:SGNH hydrolase n=1 Tax=Guyanagaster necrorhizus TaxID=856835 RepID=A0A9P7VME6_9AGAR|nr:SGNH hydrolase [Guyanagaster necrorhizus MCA 3950]KAG7443213.1 SGNH hydrolase [Guyanagaster necrorhizus MCA 3950]